MMIKPIIDKAIYSRALISFIIGIALAAFGLVLFPNGEFAFLFWFFIVMVIFAIVTYWYRARNKNGELHTATEFDICMFKSLTDESSTWLGVGIATELLASIILKYLQIDSHPTAILLVASVIVVGLLYITIRRVRAWINKGAALGNIGKHLEAIQCCDKVLEINPRYFLAWSNKGAALNELGKYQEAIECCDKALEINPRYFLAWNNKGVALENLGKKLEAIGCFKKFIEFAPPQYASQVEQTKQNINQLIR